MKVGRHEARLPVVTVDNLWTVAPQSTPADVRGGARERREALRIVRPVAAASIDIRIARASIEVRCIEHQEIKPCRLDPQENPAENKAEAERESPLEFSLRS